MRRDIIIQLFLFYSTWQYSSGRPSSSRHKKALTQVPDDKVVFTDVEMYRSFAGPSGDVIKQTQEYAKKLGDPTARNYYIKFVYYIMKAVELEMAWKRLNESARHNLAKIVPNTHNLFNRWSKTGIAFMPPKASKDMIPALVDEIGGPNFNVTDETLIKYHRLSSQEAREFYHKFVTFATMPVGLEDDWKSLSDTARNSILQLTFP